eukprot:scaffold84200_cov61-Phaeocystis_antarctica.AAC.2
MGDGVLQGRVFTVFYMHTYALYGFNILNLCACETVDTPRTRRMFLGGVRDPRGVITGRMLWGPALAGGRPALPPLLGPCFEHVAVLPHPRLRF